MTKTKTVTTLTPPDTSFIDFAEGRFDLPFELFNPKTGKTVAKFDTRTGVDAFLADGEYIKTDERRANDGLPKTFPGFGTVYPFEHDFMIIYVEFADPEKNLTVNEKVHALLAKKGKATRPSSVNKFTKALRQLVADWQAESLAASTNPKYADFKDTEVWPADPTSVHAWGPGLTLTFDGSGYDYLSIENEHNFEDYRNALYALCDLHGWYLEDYASWAITFWRD